MIYGKTSENDEIILDACDPAMALAKLIIEKEKSRAEEAGQEFIAKDRQKQLLKMKADPKGHKGPRFLYYHIGSVYHVDENGDPKRELEDESSDDDDERDSATATTVSAADDDESGTLSMDSDDNNLSTDQTIRNPIHSQ